MKWIGLAVMVIAVTAACGSEQAKTKAESLDATHTSTLRPPETGDARVQDSESLRQCANKCISSRQMQATSVDQIERDCKQYCNETQ